MNHFECYEKGYERGRVEAFKELCKAKKPEKYEAHPKDIYLCAECKSTFIVNIFGVKMPYCPNCGTKQDWREDD